MSTKSILAVSVLLNVLLLGSAVRWWTTRPAPAGTPESASVTAPVAVRPAEKTLRPTILTNTLTQRVDWRMVESEDYKKYIANLRAIGCPEETIRDIIVADVSKLFEARQKEKKGKTKKFEFWKPGSWEQHIEPDPERLALAQADAKERKNLLKELLGYEPVEKLDILSIMTGSANPFAEILDFLEPSKQTKAMEVWFNFAAIEDSRKKTFATDAEAVAAARKFIQEREAELARILTPTEHEQFNLIFSDTAETLRERAGYINFSEDEFQKICRLGKQFEVEFEPLMASKDSEDKKKYNAAHAQVNSQIQALLGDARYAEYKRAGDWAYQSIADFAEGQKLPKEAGVKVYDMKKLAEEQAGKVRGDQTLSPEQRAAVLSAIRTETERAVAQTMGQKAYEAYTQKAPWLKNLNAPPKP